MTRATVGFRAEAWNPTIGCSPISTGCGNCNAIQLAHAIANNFGNADYARATERSSGGLSWTGATTVYEKALYKPLRWAKPRVAIVGSISDLFHEGLAENDVATVFAVMALTPRHTYLISTKRAHRMAGLLTSNTFRSQVETLMKRISGDASTALMSWPLQNLWIGTSVENVATAKTRIRFLFDSPGVVRFVSLEPLLELVDLQKILRPEQLQILDWVVVGGEKGYRARPMHPDWARAIRDVCAQYAIPFFFRQIGQWDWNADWESTDWIDPEGSIFKEPSPGRQGIAYQRRVYTGRLLDGEYHDALPRAFDRSVFPSFEPDRLAY